MATVEQSGRLLSTDRFKTVGTIFIMIKILYQLILSDSIFVELWNDLVDNFLHCLNNTLYNNFLITLLRVLKNTFFQKKKKRKLKMDFLKIKHCY